MAIFVDGQAGNMLKHWLENANSANWGDATGLRGSSTAGSIYLSLHTSDPGNTATAQTSGEIAYTTYARVTLARAGASWTYTAGNGTLPSQEANATLLQWPIMTAGAGGTVLYVGFGSDLAGAGNLFFRLPVTTPATGFPVSTGITPEVAIGGLVLKFA